MINTDNITRIIKTLLDLFLLRDPQRTGLGVLLGLFIETIIRIFPTVTYVSWVNLQSLGVYQCEILGLAIIYAPLLVSHFRTDKKISSDDDVEHRILAISKLIKKGLPVAEAKRMYSELIREVFHETLDGSIMTESEFGDVRIEHVLTRRLNKLQEMQALKGIDTEPHYVIEIEDIEETLRRLRNRKL